MRLAGAWLAAAQAAGMKVLVTDHHLPGPELPPADAIINPNQATIEALTTLDLPAGVEFEVKL